MKWLMNIAALAMIGLALIGCEKKESSVKKQTTVTSPEGSTKTTTETTVETKGQNPPPASGAVPPTNP